MSLSGTIKSIQDIMRKDVGVDGDAQRISQMGWLLFLKIFDDQEVEYELTRDSYKWINGGELQVKLHSNTQNLSGIGLVSGVKYIANGVTNFQAKLAGLPSTVTYLTHFNLIEKGSGENLHGHILMRVTLNEKGLPASQVLNLKLECK